MALGHEKGWRLRNACPACCYKLEGEPELEFAIMTTIDGNNSAKRTNEFLRGTTERLDFRGSRNERWLSAEQVSRFADEVKAQSVGANIIHFYSTNGSIAVQSKKKGKGSTMDNANDFEDDWEDDLSETDPTRICIECWRNASPQERKKMYQMFDECGIFLCACRHGIVLLMCSMIRSGEL